MKKNTRYNVIIALTYSVTLIGGMFFGYKFLKDQGYHIEKPKVNTYAFTESEKREEIMHIINKNYVDEINADSLNHLPIDSLLHRLDPHSMYLPPVKAQELAEALDGNFEGIGIEYYILNDTLLVTNVVKDGPAFLAGLKRGDKILKVDTIQVSGRTLPRDQMIGKIKGKKGTSVKLTILHAGDLRTDIVSVKRGNVKVSSIDVAYMLNPETAYIRISKFGANTDKDFTESVRLLKERGMKKLVLDLRDNGGGYLTAATGLANQLFEENKLIVYTEGKHEPRMDYVATGGGVFENGKLAVLINENSASASEILAGAVQDLDRGVIIGRRSYGKGLVQEQFPFEDGSALNLTIARYYTPLGRSIQKSYKDGYAAYAHELDERSVDDLANSLKADSTDKRLSYVTASGKKVFAGGGIRPDIYVKPDTLGVNKLYAMLLNKKVMVDYVFDVLAHRYAAAFLEKNLPIFSITSTDYKDFVRYAAQNKKILIDPVQLNEAKPIISNDLKVLLYRYHLGDAGYYKAINMSDLAVKQALSSLQ